jgi:hypothetical protein
MKKRGSKYIFYGVAAGLYPALYFFSRKPDILTSLEHYIFIFSFFLLLPTVTFFIIEKISNYTKKYDKERLLTFYGVFSFLVLVQQITFVQHHKKLIILSGVVALIISYFFYRHFLKIVVLQLLFSVLTIPLLYDTIQLKNSYSKDWINTSDNIEKAIFKKKPNVYFIEADGYANFSELEKPLYDVKIDSFKEFVFNKGFKHYPNFRSNYPTTISSNASLFAMKHHYYNLDLKSDEVQHGRDIIMHDNATLKAFVNNGYHTTLITDTPYLLANRPNTLFEKSNYGFWNVSFLDNGIRKHRSNILEYFDEVISHNYDKEQFYFIQFLNPWHIKTKSNNSMGKDIEKEKWLEGLQESNEIQTKLINKIKEKDPNALIVITADHGGFVGYDYTNQTKVKTTNRDSIMTIFSSNLLIHWPNGDNPTYDFELKSSVNLFRVLISYLSEDENYLSNLQDNSSYIILDENTQKGIYKYINDSGETTFEPYYIPD